MTTALGELATGHVLASSPLVSAMGVAMGSTPRVATLKSYNTDKVAKGGRRTCLETTKFAKKARGGASALYEKYIKDT